MAKKRRRKLGKTSQLAKEWLSMKPYSSLSNYDRFYIKQSEAVFEILNKNRNLFQPFEIARDELHRLACILTSYFEDYINEIGIWKVFTRKNKELYGYYLPFFDMEDYDPEYLNPEDFNYLIWHWLGKARANEVIAPDMPSILEMGAEIYELLETEIDNAPETNIYQRFFNISDNIHYFDLKTRLKWLTKHAYAPGVIEISFRILEDALKLMEQFSDRDLEFQKQMMYATEEDHIYKNRTSFSAISILEWFTEILDGSDYIKEQILNTRKRMLSFFTLMDYNDDYWIFKHIQTDKIINVVKESVKIDMRENKIGDQFSLQLAKWKNEWWLSGTLLNMGNNQAFVEKIRKDFSSIPFQIYTEEEKAKLLSDIAFEEELYLKFYRQKMVFYDSEKALQKQMNAFMAFYNEEKSIELNIDIHSVPEVKTTNTDEVKISDNFRWKDNKKIAQFYISGIGSVMSQDVPHTIFLMEKSELTDEEEAELFYDLFSELYHPQTVRYLLENYSTKNVVYPIPISHIHPIDYAEFLLRYWNPDDFGERIPNMRFMPERRD